MRDSKSAARCFAGSSATSTSSRRSSCRAAAPCSGVTAVGSGSGGPSARSSPSRRFQRSTRRCRSGRRTSFRQRFVAMVNSQVEKRLCGRYRCRKRKTCTKTSCDSSSAWASLPTNRRANWRTRGLYFRKRSWNAASSPACRRSINATSGSAATAAGALPASGRAWCEAGGWAGSGGMGITSPTRTGAIGGQIVGERRDGAQLAAEAGMAAQHQRSCEVAAPARLAWARRSC